MLSSDEKLTFALILQTQRESGTLTLVDLPLELHFHICTYLSALDVVSFLSTCRDLYSHIRSETIWRSLSSRDFQLDDLSIFEDYHQRPEGDFTFHTVYTRFLHAYGPLLGLWASDHPFRGNVHQFRFLTKEERPGLGIIGETWHFPGSILAQDNTDTAERDMPRLPCYFRTILILFRYSESVDGSHHTPTYAVYIEHPWDRPQALNPDAAQAHPLMLIPNAKSSMHLLGETTQSYYVWHGAGLTDSTQSLHPEFPNSTTDPWYDSSRPQPRFPDGIKYPELYNNLSTVPRISNVLSICGAPSDTGLVKPPALSMSVGPYAPVDLHHPLIRGIADLRGTGHAKKLQRPVFYMRHLDEPCGRYYPLRFPPVPPPSGIPEGAFEVADVESLAGIWLTFGQFGTEVLFLEWKAEEHRLNAWKITGNVQVPRGVVSWSFDARTSGQVALDATTCHMMGDVSMGTLAFIGRGTSSGRGYVYVIPIRCSSN